MTDRFDPYHAEIAELTAQIRGLRADAHHLYDQATSEGGAAGHRETLLLCDGARAVVDAVYRMALPEDAAGRLLYFGERTVDHAKTYAGYATTQLETALSRDSDSAVMRDRVRIALGLSEMILDRLQTELDGWIKRHDAPQEGL